MMMIKMIRPPLFRLIDVLLLPLDITSIYVRIRCFLFCFVLKRDVSLSFDI